jgi:oxysterol-binding protein-related protein 9/10/11
VTRYIREKKFSEATRLNQAIEQEQQAISVARERFGIQFHARYFDSDVSSGAPTLTPEGRRVLTEEPHAFHK